MREIGLRLLGALAGALPFALTAGQAAKAQPCTPGPTPAQRPSPDLADQVAAKASEYCDAIAGARTPEEVEHFVGQLARHTNSANSLVQKQNQKTADIAEAQARLNEDEQMLAQRRAASPLAEIDGLIRADQQIMADNNAKAAAINTTGVNGGPNLSMIEQHIQEYTAQVNEYGLGAPSQRRQAEYDLAQWQAKRSELMAAKAPYADAYNSAANDLAQAQARRSAAQAAFDQANVQFVQQVQNRRIALLKAQEDASRLGDDIQQAAPYLQGSQSLTDSVIQCGRQRLAQIGGTMPTPYAPQASPAPYAPPTAPSPYTPPTAPSPYTPQTAPSPPYTPQTAPPPYAP